MSAEITQLINDMARTARAASRDLALIPAPTRQQAILNLADEISAQSAYILEENAKDMAAATGLSDAMRDRLALNKDRLNGAAEGLRTLAALPDPVGDVIAEWTQPNGLNISRIRTPLGVIGIIYEARPLVTVDAASLCLKAGNAAILRPGSDSLHTSKALGEIMKTAFSAAGLPDATAQVVPTPDRAAVGVMLNGANGNIDILVPRGGRSLVGRVQDEARVPVFSHLEGLCHLYIDKDADAEMATGIVVNSKMRRVGICGSAEKVLIDRSIAETFVPLLASALSEAGCEIVGDSDSCAFDNRIQPATDEDWRTEYLAPKITMGLVDGVDGAAEHISTFGSGHTESIITDNTDTANRFLSIVDSSIVMHNASTQFADGGEFGMGAEIGISTGRIHARGPVGAEQLTTFKYVVRGTGQQRP